MIRGLSQQILVFGAVGAMAASAAAAEDGGSAPETSATAESSAAPAEPDPSQGFWGPLPEPRAENAQVFHPKARARLCCGRALQRTEMPQCNLFPSASRSARRNTGLVI